MDVFNIFVIGVGGQGIGLLSEVILRAADHAGLNVKGVDTHGLAQRGGVVISQIRIGKKVFSPLIQMGRADLVVALERHEALRAMNQYLGDGGILIYYNTVWQPLEVRLNKNAIHIHEETISQECERRNIREYRVFKADLPDARMQNMVLLANCDKMGLIPDVQTDDYIRALGDLMTGKTLEDNLKLFYEERGSEGLSSNPERK